MSKRDLPLHKNKIKKVLFSFHNISHFTISQFNFLRFIIAFIHSLNCHGLSHQKKLFNIKYCDKL